MHTKKGEKMKKVKIVVCIVSFIVALLVMGRLDYFTSVNDVKIAIVQLSYQGQTVEYIKSFYKFQEYPFDRIFKGLVENKEFDDLVEFGRLRRAED